MPDIQFPQKPTTNHDSMYLLDAVEIQHAFSKSHALELLRQVGQNQIATLSTREFEVLRRVTSGIPNRTIARQLTISVKTVEKYRGSLMRKLGVRTVPDLMRIWLRANPHELDNFKSIE